MQLLLFFEWNLLSKLSFMTHTKLLFIQAFIVVTNIAVTSYVQSSSSPWISIFGGRLFSYFPCDGNVAFYSWEKCKCLSLAGLPHNYAPNLVIQGDDGHSTGWGGHLFWRVCKLFFESSPGRVAVLQLPCCPSKEGGLSENLLHNLRNKWPPHPVFNISESCLKLENISWICVACSL